jgi:hypothetical protein
MQSLNCPATYSHLHTAVLIQLVARDDGRVNNRAVVVSVADAVDELSSTSQTGHSALQVVYSLVLSWLFD